MWKESKLLRPRSLHNVIERERISQYLEQQCPCHLLLCVGAAGVGKTTAVAQWLQPQEHVAWLTLEEGDEQRYPYGLFAALTQLSHLPMPMIEDPHSHQWQDRFFEQHLLAQIEAISNHSFLVLDNYHFIESTHCHEITQSLIQLASDTLTIVVISRRDPVLPLGRLRLEKNITTVHGDIWPFTEQETCAYLASHGVGSTTSAPASHALRYHDVCAGWPALLHLLTHMPRLPVWANDDVQHHHFLADCPIWQYLEEELWLPLTPNQQQAFLALGVLKFCHPNVLSQLGRELADNSHWYEEVRQLSITWSYQKERVDTRLLPLLLRRFYLLKNQQLNHWSEFELNRCAAIAWQGLSSTHALTHAIQAGCEPTLVETLLVVGAELLENNALNLLYDALAILSPQAVQRSPHIALLQCWLDSRSLPTADFLNQLEQELLQNPALSAQEILGDVHALQAQCSLQLNRINAAQRFAEMALFNNLALQKRSQVTATLTLAEICHRHGENARCHVLAQQAEKLARQQRMSEMVQKALLLQAKVKLIGGALHDITPLRTRSLALTDKPLDPLTQRAWLKIERQMLQLKGDWLGINQTITSHEPQEIDTVLKLLTQAISAWSTQRIQDFEHHVQALLGYLDLFRQHETLTVSVSRILILFWRAKPDALRHWLDGAPTFPSQCAAAHQQWRNIASAYFYLGDTEKAFTVIKQHQTEAQQHQLQLEVQRYLWLQTSFYAQLADEQQATNALNALAELKLAPESLGDFYLEPTALAEYMLRHPANPAIAQISRDLKLKPRQQCHAQALLTPKRMSELAQTGMLQQMGIVEKLTEREWQVFDLIRQSWKNEQIAWHFNVAPSTVKTHIRHLYQKLAVNNRSQAQSLAQKLVTQLEVLEE